jgi:uncharacterized damage-inducible protein DinB
MGPEAAPDLIRMLEESRQELNDACAGMSEAAAVAAGEAGRWSVLECVEHVVTVESRFAERLAGARRRETAVESRGALATRVANRSRRVEAPEGAVPQGRFSSLADALEAFHGVRTATIRIVKQRAADLPMVATEHPFFGTINGRDMIEVMVGHTRRHAAQVREIRGSPGNG